MAPPSELLEPDDIPIPDVSGLVTEDDTPVDNLLSEKQMRFLTEPLHSHFRPPGGRRFFLSANVGLFPTPDDDPLVPDVLLSMDTAPKQPFTEKRNRSYFLWEHGKPPDVVIEIVSNTKGKELTQLLRRHERLRSSHYVVYDPSLLLSDVYLTHFELSGGALVEQPGRVFFPEVGLGLALWSGAYEGETLQWLRWVDADGVPVPTGAERANVEQARANAANERADAEQARAEAEQARADAEQARADAAQARAEALAAKLRELGVDLD